MGKPPKVPKIKATAGAAAQMSKRAAEQLFAQFLKNNPNSIIVPLRDDKDTTFYIDKPWNDPSIILGFTPKSGPGLAAVLNPLILPERFSALYHDDKQELEVIWTAFRVDDDVKDVVGRKFQFTYDAKTYECEFARSSERLLKLAQHSISVQASETAYRNLTSFQSYMRTRDERRHGEPLSFWVRNIERGEDFLLDFAQHLNFYLSYYDGQTPEIIIHPPQSLGEINDPTRYTIGKFPEKIKSKKIDVNVLHFWAAARTGDASRSFLYYYRILEFIAVQFLDASTRSAVRRTLANPAVLSDIQVTMVEVVNAVQRTKVEEYQRVEILLKDTLNIELLWREINLNLSSFNTETVFEGGYTLGPLVPKNLTMEQFAQNGHEAFARKIRDLRNALSHGRDVKTAAVIPPTHKNFDLISPWVCLIATAASSAILYNDAI